MKAAAAAKKGEKLLLNSTHTKQHGRTEVCLRKRSVVMRVKEDCGGKRSASLGFVLRASQPHLHSGLAGAELN
jgi:hypothetical protein